MSRRGYEKQNLPHYGHGAGSLLYQRDDCQHRGTAGDGTERAVARPRPRGSPRVCRALDPQARAQQRRMTTRMKISVRNAWFAGLCISLLLVGCGGDSAASKQTQAKQAEPPLAVTVTPVRAQKVTRSVDFVGTLYANEEVTVSSELDG